MPNSLEFRHQSESTMDNEAIGRGHKPEHRQFFDYSRVGLLIKRRAGPWESSFAIIARPFWVVHSRRFMATGTEFTLVMPDAHLSHQSETAM